MKIILTQQLQEVQWRQPREYPQTWVLRVRKPSWEMKLSCFQTYLPHVIQRYYMYLYAPNSRHFLVSLVLHLVISTSNWWSSLTEDQMFSEDKIKVVQHRSFSKFLLIDSNVYAVPSGLDLIIMIEANFFSYGIMKCCSNVNNRPYSLSSSL